MSEVMSAKIQNKKVCAYHAKKACSISVWMSYHVISLSEEKEKELTCRFFLFISLSLYIYILNFSCVPASFDFRFGTRSP